MDASSIAEELQKLHKMRQDGLITDAEMEQKRAEVLASYSPPASTSRSSTTATNTTRTSPPKQRPTGKRPIVFWLKVVLAVFIMGPTIGAIVAFNTHHGTLGWQLALIAFGLIVVTGFIKKNSQKMVGHNTCEQCKSRLKYANGRYAKVCSRCGSQQSWA